MSKIKYFVNRDKGTVVAKLSVSKREMEDELDARISKHSCVAQEGITNMLDTEFLSYASPFVWNDPNRKGGMLEFSAKVKCTDHDYFNEKLGKALAKAKLMEKVNDYKYTIMSKITLALTNMMEAAGEIMDSYEDKVYAACGDVEDAYDSIVKFQELMHEAEEYF